MALGLLTSKLLVADWGRMGSPTKTALSFGPGIIAVCGFGNASGLPLSLMPAILAGHPALGTKEHASLVITLYGMLNKIGLWALAPGLLDSSAPSLDSASSRRPLTPPTPPDPAHASRPGPRLARQVCWRRASSTLAKRRLRSNPS